MKYKQIFLLTSILLIIVPFSYANCCINPNVPSEYICTSAVTQDDCCPPDSYQDYYSPKTGVGPQSRTVCISSYYTPSSCTSVFLSQCLPGCCCGTLYPGTPEQIQISDIVFASKCVASGLNFYPNIYYQTECSAKCSIPPPDEDPTPVTPDCDAENAITDISAELVKGENYITLSWSDECAEVLGLSHYEIKRCIQYNGKEYCDEIPRRSTSAVYTDTSILWNRLNHKYSVIAYYSSGDQSGEKAITKSSGDLECWKRYSQSPFCVLDGYYSDEPYASYIDGDETGQFVTEDNLPIGFNSIRNRAYSCDVQNRLLSAATECGDGTTCVIQDGTTPICAYTGCSTSEDNPFDLFWTESSCEETTINGVTKQKFCFYDSSATSIDDCYSCGSPMACYDYKSQEACESDNCGLENCGWAQFGGDPTIGLCIDLSTSNCEWCDRSGSSGMENYLAYNQVFGLCTQEKADLLSITDGLNGFSDECFYDPNTGSASSCSSSACTDYNSESTCVQDPCSLWKNADLQSNLLCKWYPNLNKCRKNADLRLGDQNPDCAPDYEEECELDTFSPSTELIPSITKNVYDYFTISITDKIDPTVPEMEIIDENYKTYIVTRPGDPSSSPPALSEFTKYISYPLLEVEGVYLLDSTNIDNLWILEDGPNTIWYFSQDANKNVESPIKNKTMWAYANASSPKVAVPLVSVDNRSDQIDGKYYTKNTKPTITIVFVPPAIVAQNAAAISPGAPAMIMTSYPNNQVFDFKVQTNLSQATYDFTVFASKVTDKATKKAMIEDFKLNFVVDTTKPKITSRKVAEGETITSDGKITIGFDFNEPVRILNATLNGQDITQAFIDGWGVSHSSIELDLPDAVYTLNLTVEDYAANKLTNLTHFSVDKEETNIWIEEPSFGVSPTNEFILKVRTDNTAECRYNLDYDIDFANSLMLTPNADATAHMTTLTIGDEESHSLYVKCNNPIWGITSESFSIKVDLSPPNFITSYAYPNPTAARTTFKVQTDDKTICKYGTGNDYEAMAPFVGFNISDFKNINSQQITLIYEGEYTYFITCENKAGLKSTVPIPITVDPTISLLITDFTEEYMKGNATLKLEANKESQCLYSTNPLVPAGSPWFGPLDYFHEVSLDLDDGNYSYYAKCISGQESVMVPLKFTLDNTPPVMEYVDDTNIYVPSNSEESCINALRVRFDAQEDVSKIVKFNYSLILADGTQLASWEELEEDRFGNWIIIRNQNNSLKLVNGKTYYFKAKALNPVVLWSAPMTSNGIKINENLCNIACSSSKDNCCSVSLDTKCDPDCMQGFDPDCGTCTPNEGDCCNLKSDTICDRDCPYNVAAGVYADPDCSPVCIAGTCDLNNNMFCDTGFWVDPGDNYCDEFKCGRKDPDCGMLCDTEGKCETESKQWCYEGAWTTQNYCVHCNMYDSTCKSCEDDVCDTESQTWCDKGTWSALNYCNECGGKDSSCNAKCESESCDLTAKKWCDGSTWSQEGYCDNCGDVDSTCTYTCTTGSCDTSARLWCDEETWVSDEYCLNCGDVDAWCRSPCADGSCDQNSNSLCENSLWNAFFSDYCNNCEDSECPGSCEQGSCDIKSNKRCLTEGSWDSDEYCDFCGEEDSDCDIACISDSCDIVEDKWCYNSGWRESAYCDFCGFQDFDTCATECSDGSCDVNSKLVCNSGAWVNTSYCSICYTQDSSCPSACSNIKDNCCNTVADFICDVECTQDADPDCGNCTNIPDDCCLPNPDGKCDVDCITGLDPDCANSCSQDGTCEEGHPCIDDTECISNWCNAGFCAASVCDDEIENGDESDIDCGGPCSGCEVGKNCRIDTDCTSGFCKNAVCADAGECEDKRLSNGESDIDCGGPCPNCDIGQYCNFDDDCALGAECVNSVCTVPTGLKDLDSDGDGIPDEWENLHGLDPANPYDAMEDPDGDGLTNAQEYLYNTDPHEKDTDGDGFSDGEEIDKGTDPLDPNDYPKSNIVWILLLIIIILAILGLVGYLVYILWGDKIKQQISVWTGKPLKPKYPFIQRRPIYNPSIRPQQMHGTRPTQSIQRPTSALDRLRALSSGKTSTQISQTTKTTSSDLFNKLKSIAEKEKGKSTSATSPSSSSSTQSPSQKSSAFDKLRQISGGKTNINIIQPDQKTGGQSAFDRLKSISSKETVKKESTIKETAKSQQAKPQAQLSTLDKLRQISSKVNPQPEKPKQSTSGLSALDKLKQMSLKPKTQPAKPTTKPVKKQTTTKKSTKTSQAKKSISKKPTKVSQTTKTTPKKPTTKPTKSSSSISKPKTQSTQSQSDKTKKETKKPKSTIEDVLGKIENPKKSTPTKPNNLTSKGGTKK